MYTQLYLSINHSTHAFKMFIYIQIGKTNHFDTKLIQPLCPAFIRDLSIFAIMLRAIQFNRYCCCITVKIQNVITDNSLTINLHGIISQKIIPKMLFFPRHFSAQRSGIGKEARIARQCHNITRSFPLPKAPREGSWRVSD